MKRNAVKELEKITGKKTSFAMALKAYRTREGLTQSDLAEKLGVKKSYISNVENQRNFVTVEQAFNIAEALQEPSRIWIKWALQDSVDRIEDLTGEHLQVELTPVVPARKSA